MLPHTHLLVSVFFAELLVYTGMLTHYHALIVGLIAVFIDLDHYFRYVIEFKSINFLKFWNKTVDGTIKNGRTWVHHWPGFIVFTVVTVVLFLLNTVYGLVFGIAYYTHMVLDYVFLNFVHIKPVRQISKKYVQLAIHDHELVLDLVFTLALVILLII